MRQGLWHPNIGDGIRTREVQVPEEAEDHGAIREPARMKPRAFLSYSYSSHDYVERVVALAHDLMAHHVDVVFDQFELADGQDLNAFMERAVTDPSVTHVLILCDPVYTEKADARLGGVGTETLIISPDVYQSATQKRVVPIVMARDENNQVRVPTYLRGRRFVDLSSHERYPDGLEQLLRGLHDRPARMRPQLGPMPSWLDESTPQLETRAAAALARSSIVGHKPDAAGRLGDYLGRLTAAFAKLEVTEKRTQDALLAHHLSTITSFRPYRDELTALVRDTARYATDNLRLVDRLHQFFEGLASILYAHENRGWQWPREVENLGFLAYELMLYAAAALIRERAFVPLARLARPVFVAARSQAGALRPIDVLDIGYPLLSEGGRDGRRYGDPAASLLRERIDPSGASLEDLAAADLCFWFRCATDPELRGSWSPRTVAVVSGHAALPLFAQAMSADRFAELAPALGVGDRKEFVSRFRALDDDAFRLVHSRLNTRGGYAFLLGIATDE